MKSCAEVVETYSPRDSYQRVGGQRGEELAVACPPKETVRIDLVDSCPWPRRKRSRRWERDEESLDR